MTTTAMRRRLARRTTTVAVGMVSALVLTACASASQSTSNGTTTKFSSDLVSQAKQEALADSGGKKLGGSITVIGVNGGNELKVVQSVIKPFEDATGITVNYTGSQDLTAIVAAKVSAGAPPDVVDDAGAGSLVGYAKKGLLKNVGAMVGEDKLKQAFAPGLLDAASVEGTTYGVWTEIDNFMLWYDPKTYTGPKPPQTWDQLDSFTAGQAATGKTPWCMAQNAGANSGFPGSQWIENWFVKHYGADLTRQWATGRLPWTSPQVKAAFQAFGAVASNAKMVNGGPAGVLSAPIVNNGTGLLSNPAKCQVMLWGVYGAGLTLNQFPQAKSITDLDFFPVPAGNAAYDNLESIGGHIAYAFTGKPQTAAFMRYWASSQAQRLFVTSGQWTEANQQIPASAYANPILAKAKTTLLAGKTLVTGPSILAPGATVIEFYRAVVAYIQNPASLDGILANLQKTATSS